MRRRSTVPIARRECRACRVFEAECDVPVGDNAVRLCWLCAHHVSHHEASLDEAPTGECECTPDQVYPSKFRASLARRQAETEPFMLDGKIVRVS